MKSPTHLNTYSTGYGLARPGPDKERTGRSPNGVVRFSFFNFPQPEPQIPNFLTPELLQIFSRENGCSHSLSLFTQASQFDCRRPKSFSPPLNQNLSPKSSHSPWLGSTNLSLQSSHLRTPQTKQRPINATVALSLPTANPERFSMTEKVPKWSAKALRAYGFTRLEAIKMWDTDTRTGYLVTGILLDGTSLGAKFLLANGITISKVREEILKATGRRELREVPTGFPPLDESTQRVLDWAAADEKLKSGESGEITTAHILAGVWSEKKSVGHSILATLGFKEEKVKELNTLISIPCV